MPVPNSTGINPARIILDDSLLLATLSRAFENKKKNVWKNLFQQFHTNYKEEEPPVDFVFNIKAKNKKFFLHFIHWNLR